MKKNIRDYKKVGVQFAYVLDSINFEGSDIEKVKFFFDEFNVEYNNEDTKRIYPSIQVRISEYLKGLPSCINVAFTDYSIIETGKLWGYCNTDKQAAKFVDIWFYTIAFRLFQLKKYYNL